MVRCVVATVLLPDLSRPPEETPEVAGVTRGWGSKRTAMFGTAAGLLLLGCTCVVGAGVGVGVCWVTKGAGMRAPLRPRARDVGTFPLPLLLPFP